jgi:outer membrane protein assembly factor BamA
VFDRFYLPKARTVRNIVLSSSAVVEDLSATGCFDSVKTNAVPVIGPDGQILPNTARLEIDLVERNWYKIHFGASTKNSASDDSALPTSALGDAFDGVGLKIPKMMVENSFTLYNLQGNCSKTGGAYSIDQTGVGELNVFHSIPNISSTVTPTSLTFSAFTDTLERPASSFDCHSRTFQTVIRHGAQSRMQPTPYSELKYSLTFRDSMPHLSPNTPYTSVASPEIVSTIGPNLIHSLQGTIASNGQWLDDNFVPTIGVDGSATMELAGPPGDVGHIKSNTQFSVHIPLTSQISTHFSSSIGVLQPLSFGNMCNGASSPIDRFPPAVGIRGFTNIGPRAPNLDCLGGTFTTNNSLSISAPLPGNSGFKGRGFGFLSGGTLCNLDQVSASMDTLKKFRVSAGLGLTAPTPVGRVEVTYSKILRKADGDGTQPMQLGISFTVG